MKSKSYTIHKLWSLLLVLFLFSCASETEDWQPGTTEAPIEFEFLMPEDGPATRNKTSFANGNRVYITAKVTLADNSEQVMSTIVEYQSGKFQPASGSNRLMWPETAVKATFRAYYLPETHNATAPADGTPVTIPFNELKENGTNDDLLLAQQEIVGHNGVVTLRFAHTTTKLRFNGLKREGTTIELVGKDLAFTINNRLVVSYSAAEGYTHTYENDGSNNGITITKAANVTSALFFLDVTADWAGQTFTLVQTDASSTVLKTTELGEAARLPTMKRGRAYRIGFYGKNENPALEEENAWYKEPSGPTFTTAQEIQNYLNGKTELTEDLDFNNILLDDPAIIFPSTRSITLGGNTFDGKNFAIRNVYVRNGLFGAIPAGATIRNLRLENVKVIAEDGEAAGLLAPSNAGRIENVRLSGNNQIGTSNVFAVGGLVGINTGIITKVQISGALAMEAYIDNTTEAVKPFAVGGLAGLNSTTITNCEINAGGLLEPAGTYTAGDIAIGGMVGYQKSGTTSGCATFARIDATRLTACNSYVGGFCGVNQGTLNSNEANGEVRGALFTARAATGGFLGYTFGSAVVNGAGATGKVTESDPSSIVDATTAELYTGGFCGFAEIDLKNTYSVGTLIPATSVPAGATHRKGALTGLISADKTVYNSFSITILQGGGGGPLTFSGSTDSSNICKTQNTHLRGVLLTEQGVETGTPVTVTRLNNAVSTANGYWNWNSSATVYNGVPYLIKK